jgi:hypothetical protein
MKIEKNIIPWKCHVCGKDFDVTFGGICSKCNKPTCSEHLGKRSSSKTDELRLCTECRTEEPVQEQTKGKRIKYTFVVIAAFLAVHSSVIASNILWTDQISPYAEQGLGALSTHVVSFIGLSLLTLTIKHKFWRTGGILAALSALSRSCATSFPDHKLIFGIITIVISSASIVALTASLRLETFDSNWWEDNPAKTSYKALFVFIVVVAIVGIFFFWSRK